MIRTNPRPDLAAHDLAVRADFHHAVKRLRELLGASLVAYIASVKETRAVHQWADSTRLPDALTQSRVRLALQIAHMIASIDGPGVAQAWFQGLKPPIGGPFARALASRG